MSTDKLEEKTPDELRIEIQKTRENLAQKAASLGQELQHAGDEVTDTVKAKIESAQEALSLDYHMDRHPWRVVALAVVAGAAANRLFIRPAKTDSDNYYDTSASTTSRSRIPKEALGLGLLKKLGSTFESEIKEVQDHLAQAGLDLLRDVAQKTLPASISKYLSSDRSSSESKNVSHSVSHGTAQLRPSNHSRGQMNGELKVAERAQS
jgi:ElaB/YqjD/DUF883 family membrane-anchored ribosome-binding protein